MTNIKNRLSKLEARRPPRKDNRPRYALIGTTSAIVDSRTISLEEYAKLPQPVKVVRLGIDLNQI